MTLSLCMIVKNEADVLARALGNASAYADEIIVVDTGSTDGTKGIAKKLTDKVFDYEWHDDFAAARNYALSKATCDLWMWLDADDIVPPETARGIAELVRAFPTGVDVVMLPYVLDTDSAGEPTFSYYRERIMRRSPEYMWQGRVHEAVTLRGNIVRAPHRIIHAKPTGRTSGTRNLDIYKKMLADGAELNARERYYYARELYYNNDHKTAAEEFERFLGAVRAQRRRRVHHALALSYQARRPQSRGARAVPQLRVRAADGRGGLRDRSGVFFGRRVRKSRILVRARARREARSRFGRVRRSRLLRIFAVRVAYRLLRPSRQGAHGVLLALPREKAPSRASVGRRQSEIFQ